MGAGMQDNSMAGGIVGGKHSERESGGSYKTKK
jgi:hypothetical protein